MGLCPGLPCVCSAALLAVRVCRRRGTPQLLLAPLAATASSRAPWPCHARGAAPPPLRSIPARAAPPFFPCAAVLLRVLPALLYFFPFYYLAGFQTAAAYAAAYCLILVTFSCVVGAMSMSVTGGLGGPLAGVCKTDGRTAAPTLATPRYAEGQGSLHGGAGFLLCLRLAPFALLPCALSSACPPLLSCPGASCAAVASNTAGQASFAMNFLLLFSLVFTGFLVNVNSIPGGWAGDPSAFSNELEPAARVAAPKGHSHNARSRHAGAPTHRCTVPPTWPAAALSTSRKKGGSRPAHTPTRRGQAHACTCTLN